MDKQNLKVLLLNGPPGCVDGDTEFLTPSGWKKMKDYSKGDKVLTFYPDKIAKFKEPIDFIESKDLHEMVNFGGPNVEMTLTRNHKVFYYPRRTEKGKFLYARQLEDKILKTGRGMDIRIPQGFTSGSPEYPKSDIELRYTVMYSAEATITDTSTRRSVISLKHEYKKDRCRSLLNEMGIVFTESSEIPSLPGYTRFYFFSPIEKGLPKYFYSLSARQCKIVEDELYRWDGCEKTRTFRTTSKEELEVARFVMLASGDDRGVSVRADDRVGEAYGPLKQYTRKSICYEARKVSYSNLVRASRLEVKGYVYGKCYCFTTESGMWVARKNNKVFVTGNSGKDYAAEYIKNAFGGHVFSFKKYLVDLTKNFYCLGSSVWEEWYTEKGKNVPREALGGLSQREALIHVSENVIKPVFGDEVFGECAALDLQDEQHERNIHLAVSSDSGFEEETYPLIDFFGANNVFIVQLYSEGCSFDGDSRSYLDVEEIPDGNYFYVENKKDDKFLEDIAKITQYILSSGYSTH